MVIADVVSAAASAGRCGSDIKVELLNLGQAEQDGTPGVGTCEDCAVPSAITPQALACIEH